MNWKWGVFWVVMVIANAALDLVTLAMHRVPNYGDGFILAMSIGFAIWANCKPSP